MDIGEKIKSFRQLNGLTQKSLGDITGIGEASIRKYELGIRNPKPAQIKKIAQALGIGENVLLNIPLNTLSIETVGDAMSLYFLLETQLGISFVTGRNNDGTFDAKNLTFSFDNLTFNKYLAKWLTLKHEENQKLERLYTEDQKNEMERLHQLSCEVQKTILMREKEKL